MKNRILKFLGNKYLMAILICLSNPFGLLNNLEYSWMGLLKYLGETLLVAVFIGLIEILFHLRNKKDREIKIVECYKSGKECKHNCPGQCRESC